ncbi:MAG: M14 family zinc carboxypeptidase, partial [Thermomicrobiales bacterium]
PPPSAWVALIDLAARLGLETGGIAFPVAVAGAAVATSEGPLLRCVLKENQQAGVGEWALWDAAAVRALVHAGLDGAAEDAFGGDAPPPPPDLARFYEPDGPALADDDGDLFADRLRLCPVVPPNLPVDIGLALLDLAARLGLEAAGVCFPVAATAGEALPADSVPLYLAWQGQPPAEVTLVPATRALPLAPGEGVCTLARTAAGGPALAVWGDVAGVAWTLRQLAAAWPCLRVWDAAGATASNLTDHIVTMAHGEDAAGRAALLAADLARFMAQGSPCGEVRLLGGEVALRAAATNALAGAGLTVVAAPDDAIAFADDWSDEWEVDRARRVVREQVLPALDRQAPADLLVLVSEPPAIRQALAAELTALLPAESRVTVLSAFKPGLCWLREVITPAWVARGDVARVAITYRPFAALPGEQFLDLPMRPRQELYPGDELLAAALNLPLDAVTIAAAPDDAPDVYQATAYDAAGATLDSRDFSPRWYARPYLNGVPGAGQVTVSTGAVVARRAGRTVVDTPLPTDLDRFWDYWQGTVLPRVREFILAETGGAPAPEAQPFFAALDIEVWCSEPDEALGLREERDSSAEALHEDLYFATLDYIEALGSGRGWSGTLGGGAGGAALDAPGPVRPFVHVRQGQTPAARVTLRRRLRQLAEFVPASGGTRVPLGRLPDGPRPRATIDWLRCGAGTLGFIALGISLAGADARAGDALRDALPSASPDADAISLNIVSEGSVPVTAVLPLSTLAFAPRGNGRRPEFTAVLDEEHLRPALAWLRMLPGVTVRQAGRSFGGRSIAALEVTAPLPGVVWSRKKQSLHKPTLLVVARHHANEPASTPAALALAECCAINPVYRSLLERVNLVVIPIENPDGAALHGLMAIEHPTWKLHAARYNAAGYEFARDFFNPATPWGEARVRPALWHAWAPDVVVDNHGVPSHEWNQIFDGFGSPPRFGVSYWIVPALLYGILRYPTGNPAHYPFALAVRDRIAAAVAA